MWYVRGLRIYWQWERKLFQLVQFIVASLKHVINTEFLTVTLSLRRHTIQTFDHWLQLGVTEHEYLFNIDISIY